MDKQQEYLNRVRIASPCKADWDKMSGDERKRHCQQCDLDVFNISEMTKDEATKLIQNASGRLCIQMYRRHDGTVLTKDCPKGLERVRRMYRNCAAAALGLFAWVGFVSPSFAEPGNPETKHALRGTVAPKNYKQLGGKMMPAEMGDIEVPAIKGEAVVPAPTVVEDVKIKEKTPVRTNREYTPIKKTNADKNRLLAAGLITMVLAAMFKLVFGSLKRRSSIWIVATCSISAFVAIGLIWQRFW